MTKQKKSKDHYKIILETEGNVTHYAKLEWLIVKVISGGIFVMVLILLFIKS